MRLAFAVALAALTGFIALSYEIAWMRLYGFVSAGRPAAFGVLLGSYLLGLAAGALWSRRYQDESDASSKDQLFALGGFVLGANALGFLLVPLASYAVTVVPYWTTFPLVALAAAALGATLPLICHFAIPADARAGARLSYVYLGNIVGSGAGSLVTGFVLMDRLTLQQISVLLLALGLVLAAALSLGAGRPLAASGRRLAAIATAGLALGVGSPWLFDGLWERLQWKRDYRAGVRFIDVVESRHGVITVDADHTIYGGGIYDGKLSVALEPGSWLVRPYSLSLFHPAPRNVLVIGMSGGAWTRVVAANPHVEHVTVVEISPSYLSLIPRYPAVAPILADPDIDIHIDDGRRWLRRNPDRRFDAVVLNMTYHWREHATHLLSREFMELVRSRLEPGGIFLFNATGSADVARTALEVFPHTAMVLNNVLASDAPIAPDKERWRRTLEAYAYDGRPLFEATAEGRARLEGVLALADTFETDRAPEGEHPQYRLRTRARMVEETRDAVVVTDDNMAVEYGRAWF